MLPKRIEGRSEEPVEGEAAEDALLLALGPIHANIESLRGGGIEAGQIEIVERAIVGSESHVDGLRYIALGKLGEKLQRNRIGIGDHVVRRTAGAFRPALSGCVGS